MSVSADRGGHGQDGLSGRRARRAGSRCDWCHPSRAYDRGGPGDAPVVLDATAMLRAAGYRVVDSRTRDSSLARLRPGNVTNGIFTVRGRRRNLVARDLCADLAKASILIGVYFNAGAPQGSGSLTLYDRARPSGRPTGVSRRWYSAPCSLPCARMAGPSRATAFTATSAMAAAHSGGPRALRALILRPPKSRDLATPAGCPGRIEPLFITDPGEGSIASSRTGSTRSHAVSQPQSSSTSPARQQLIAPLSLE